MKFELTKMHSLVGLALIATASGFATGKTVAAGVGITSILRDPYLTSWMLNRTRTVANVRLTDTSPGTTKWSAIDPGWRELLPTDPNPIISGVLADVTGVRHNPSFVYIISSGLASYTMGPWQRDGGPDGKFEFRPIDRTTAQTLTWDGVLAGSPLYTKIPRNPSLATAGEYPTGLGQIGVWVNGTSVYNPMAGYSYWNGGLVNRPGTWNTDAYWQEGETFDPSGFHQSGPGPVWGQHHSHINPIVLRWQLGDHVVLSTTKEGVDEFSTKIAGGKHSPILGWAHDGYPIYGPLGYVDKNNPLSGVRVMRSGYVLRNGQLGSRNLYATGRDQLPRWAMVVQGRTSTSLKSSEKGPSPGVSWWMPDPDFPLGCFVEDWDYRGNLMGGGTYGVDWDLDECNARNCVTPEFPNGTYAYFVSLNDGLADLPPTFPYILGPSFRGVPIGGEVDLLPLGLWMYY